MLRRLYPTYQRLVNFIEAYQESKKKLEEESKRETDIGRFYEMIKENNKASRYI